MPATVPTKIILALPPDLATALTNSPPPTILIRSNYFRLSYQYDWWLEMHKVEIFPAWTGEWLTSRQKKRQIFTTNQLAAINQMRQSILASIAATIDKRKPIIIQAGS